jgi:hypothetical protein
MVNIAHFSKLCTAVERAQQATMSDQTRPLEYRKRVRPVPMSPFGSIASIWRCQSYFRFSPDSRRRQVRKVPILLQNSFGIDQTAWVRHRSEIAARLVSLREISRTAFWEFCNSICHYRKPVDLSITPSRRMPSRCGGRNLARLRRAALRRDRSGRIGTIFSDSAIGIRSRIRSPWALHSIQGSGILP